LKLMSGRSYAKFFIQRVKPEHCRACGFAKEEKKGKVFMKKTLLIVAMLLLVSPVMATTTVNVLVNPADQFVGPDGNKVQPVSIAYTSNVDIRAFALDINIDNVNGAPNFQNIRNFKVGESNGAMVGGSSGYGIFPSRFRDFIQVLNGSTIYAGDGGWNDPNYNPTTSWNEPGTTSHTWGMGYPQMVVEMGTLYSGDPNKPAQSGTLFTFDVNSYGLTGTYHITVVADTLRGGVVNTDGNTIVATYGPNNVTFACSVPNIVSMVMTDANTAIIGANFTVGTITYQCSNTVTVGHVISQNPVAGPATCGIAVAYVVSTGPCSHTISGTTGLAGVTMSGLTGNPVTDGSGNYTAQVADGWSGTVTPTLACYSFSPASITYTNVTSDQTGQNYTATALTYTISGQVVGAVAPKNTGISGLVMSGLPGSPITNGTGNYTATVSCGWSGTVTPTDANGQWTFSPVSQTYSNVTSNQTQNYTGTATECMNKLNTAYSKWVTYNKPDCWCYQRQCRGDADGVNTLGKPVASPDLTIFKAAVGQTSAYVKTLVVGGKPGICADFDHLDTLSKPVGSPDLTIFKAYVGLAPASVPVCPSGTINAWKN
jgi:hypothetical protein